ncbi:hypothetical protein GCM10011588_56730 [Nocardia jinanensis]|uniref:Uncharacterized protein n=1 Tax=Nocardia jinanensis TaxID=382504 RepID=A0A917RUG7_9NOCA|nr:hypothetical protein GCM10011588_56730 [Nocardia jinanensis]
MLGVVGGGDFRGHLLQFEGRDGETLALDPVQYFADVAAGHTVRFDKDQRLLCHAVSLMGAAGQDPTAVRAGP